MDSLQTVPIGADARIAILLCICAFILSIIIDLCDGMYDLISRIDVFCAAFDLIITANVFFGIYLYVFGRLDFTSPEQDYHLGHVPVACPRNAGVYVLRAVRWLHG